MSRKPENTFIASVHRHLPVGAPHWEKMNNPYRGGTADVWYSGKVADHWIEFKFIPKIPIRASEIEVDLSPLQLDWLIKRDQEGRAVSVILGCPDGGVILYPHEWKARSIATKNFVARLTTRKELATWIVRMTEGSLAALKIGTK